MAVDNHTTRKLVNDYCAKLKNVVLISGGNDGMEEEHGTARFIVEPMAMCRSTSGSTVTTEVRHWLSSIPRLATLRINIPTELSCGELVVSVPQILFTNMQVAVRHAQYDPVVSQ